MQSEHSREILTILQLNRLCRQKNKLIGRQPESFIKSFFGVVIDSSNYLSNKQKISVIDYTWQNQPLEILLCGETKDRFFQGLKIGDILFCDFMHVAYFQGKINAIRSDQIDNSHIRVFPVLKDINESDKNQKINHANNVQSFLSERLNILYKFSFDYFSSNKVPINYNKQKNQLNPECSQIPIILKHFTIIAKVFQSQFKNIVRFTNEREEFFMKYHMCIQPGIYVIRVIEGVKKIQEPNIYQFYANQYTNFLEVSPWMRSYYASQWDSDYQLLLKKMKTSNQVSTWTYDARINELQYLPLKQLVKKDEHFSDVIVRCQFLDILTPFDQIFKKLIIKKSGKKSKYEQHSWDYPQGEVILSIHMAITDPSMLGQSFNVFIYSFDGKGAQFFPGLYQKELDQTYIENKKQIQTNYNNTINTLLQQTSYDKKPIQLILSPLSSPYQGTIYRIINTRLLI